MQDDHVIKYPDLRTQRSTKMVEAVLSMEDVNAIPEGNVIKSTSEDSTKAPKGLANCKF